MDHLRDEIRNLSQAVQNRVLVQNSEVGTRAAVRGVGRRRVGA